MQVPRSVAPAVLLVVAVILVPLAGVWLADSVRPVLPAVAAGPVGQTPPIPAMPDPPATVRPLTTWFEPLPILDPGSVAETRPFLSRYRALPVGDMAAATGLIDVALAEISVAPTARELVRDFRDALVLPPDEPVVPDDDFEDETDEPVVGPFDTPEFQALSKRAMTAVVADPTNARAVNDLAVAIATTALASPTLLPDMPDEGPTIAPSPQLRDAAVRLLEMGLASFPADRAMTINLAYLRSIEGGSEDDAEAEDQASDLLQAFDPALVALEALVAGAPTDVAARALLANLMIRTDAATGLDRALTTAEPVVADPTTEAAGRIIRGDSLLYAADRLDVLSPFTARSTVRRALDDYDRAIELAGDAAAYAGRARALDLLGSREAALEAQREAVRLIPSSVAWRLRLAQLEGCLEQTAAWRQDAQEAFTAASATKAVPVVGTRYVLADAPGRNYGRYSVGSDLPTWDVTLRIPATGSIIVAIDPFPEPPACMTAEPSTTTAIDDATIEVALAAIADDDLAGARTALAARRALLPATDDEEDPIDPTAADAFGTALDLLAGKPLPEDDTSLDTFLPLASRLPPVVQGRVCRAMSDAGGLIPEYKDALTVCIAESVDRTDDRAGAAQAIGPAVRLDDQSNPTAGSTVLKAGMLSELTDQLEVARTRYEAAATYTDTAIAGLLRLGDLDLGEGDASGALDHYALAAAAIRTQSAAADGTVMSDALAGRLRQYLDNNRGIALLMTARSAVDAPPDCVAYAAICRQAGEAFAAAMAADPMNPVYPMNAAWVARLTGDPERATALLADAIAKGTPLGAAADNDLGVMAAQRGDVDGARTRFLQAIATHPGYDLAIWNLGVLEAREAGPLIVAGQSLLAEATDLNPDLLISELAFLPDDRVYRVEVSGTQLEVARAPGTGAAIGAVAFGAIATVGAIGQLLSGIGGDVQGAAETVASEGLARAGRRLRGLGGRLPNGGRRWPSWLAWLPAIVLLTVTTAWTAAWMAPDALMTALLIGLVAAGLALITHTCGHLVVAGRLGASLRPSGWSPGIALALVGMPFHVPAGPFLAERIETGDPRRDWWVSIAGVLANLAAAGIALLIYLAAPMPFLRILIATQLAVAAFALIPSDPLDGDRLSTRPIVLALLALGVAAASAAIAIGAI